MPAPANFAETVAGDVSVGLAHYGDIDVSPELFIGYVWDIVCKHRPGASDESSAVDFTKRLYLRDLYLSCGCVHNKEKAWATFDSRYRRFIADLVRFAYRYGADTEEIADAVLVSLYFNDRSGRQRIASYDGRSSLATWLRVIVINRAINERNDRKMANDESIGDVPDGRALTNIESAVRAERYGKILTESLVHALRELTAKERLMLLWRYDENRPLGEIAKLMGIHQSNVTRQLLRVQAKLRESVIQTLASRHQLSASAIQECLTDVVDNPQMSISIVNLIKATPKPVAAFVKAGLLTPGDELPRIAESG